MNKVLSDDFDPILQLQGLSWFTRKAIRLATVVLTIREYKEGAVVHIDITSVASGLSTTQENRTLDWTDRDHADRIFGKVKGRSRMVQKGSISKEGPGSEEDIRFLKGQVLKDGKTSSQFLENDAVQSFVVNQDSGGWTAEQFWNFENVDGKRYYTRRVVVAKGKEVRRARLVYNYTGPVDKGSTDEDDGLAYGDE